ncbi:Hypothetical predicted protein, partial [Paramuricea clavata]
AVPAKNVTNTNREINTVPDPVAADVVASEKCAQGVVVIVAVYGVKIKSRTHHVLDEMTFVRERPPRNITQTTANG